MEYNSSVPRSSLWISDGLTLSRQVGPRSGSRPLWIFQLQCLPGALQSMVGPTGVGKGFAVQQMATKCKIYVVSRRVILQ